MDCKKTKYNSLKVALEDIERIKKKTNRAVFPIGAYNCKHCKFWHLTSKPNKDLIIAQKDLLIARLESELKIAEEELVKARKGDNKEIRVDERIKQVRTELSAKTKENRELRKSNSDLIAKNHQLEFCKRNNFDDKKARGVLPILPEHCTDSYFNKLIGKKIKNSRYTVTHEKIVGAVSSRRAFPDQEFPDEIRYKTVNGWEFNLPFIVVLQLIKYGSSIDYLGWEFKIID